MNDKIITVPYQKKTDDIHISDFRIRLANQSQGRNKASMLIQKMYQQRGYNIEKVDLESDVLTLTAYDNDELYATMTLNIDSGINTLKCEELYSDVINSYRKQNVEICEVIRLAIENQRSLQMFTSLIHIITIYAGLIFERDFIFIEVNPRHVNFYKRMLGFEVVGEERLHKTVNAPAVLCVLNMKTFFENVDKYGGKPELAKTTRNMFPYLFSPEEQEGLKNRLLENLNY